MLERSDGPECPKCGCQASHQVGGFGYRSQKTATGIETTKLIRHACDHCGTQFQVPAPPQPTEKPDHPYCVPYKSNTCPRCESLRTEVVSVRAQTELGKFRYHRCRDCRYTFKTLQPPPRK